MSTQRNFANRGNRGGGRGGQGPGRGQGPGSSRGSGPQPPSTPQAGPRGTFRGGRRGGSDASGSGIGRHDFRGGRGQGHLTRQAGPAQTAAFQPPTTPVNVPDRLSDANLNTQITTYRAASDSSDPVRPLRPGYGTLGTPIKVQANFFPLTKIPDGPYYDYAVTIDPKPRNTGEQKQIFKLLAGHKDMEQYNHHIAHDGTQRLVSAAELPVPFHVNVLYHEDEDEPTPNSTPYVVSVKYQGELDLSQLKEYTKGKVEARKYDIQPVIGALDLVVQQHASQEGFRVGKSNKFFIPSKAERYEFGPSVEAFQGFYLSVRPTYKELMVNVNACVTAFFKPGNLVDTLLSFQRGTSGGGFWFPDGAEKLRIRVKTLHTGYRKKIKNIGDLSARRQTFIEGEGKNKKTVTVEQYFKRCYNTELRHPDDVPVVDVSGPNHPTPIWVPAELCEVLPGQPLFDLPEKVVAELIKVACNAPGTNRNSILTKGFPSLGLAPRLPPLEGFGLEVSSELATMPARELAPPRVTYAGAQRPVNVKGASWNFMSEKFHRGARVDRWWVVVVKDPASRGGGQSEGKGDPKIRKLVEEFAAKCRSSGIGMAPASGPGSKPPEYIEVRLPPQQKGRRDRQDGAGVIKRVFEEKLAEDGGVKPTFALVLLENHDSHIYPAVKRIGDVELGLQTVHILLEKFFRNRRQDQYYSNVALKVNTKLGGINHKLDRPAMKWLTEKRTMMVGIDVTHPGLRAKLGAPSITAVVANVDDDFVQFPGSIRIQEGRKEMVEELDQMMIERLQVYQRKNGNLPERVFVFRDGVSEGQFDSVNKLELPKILKAFEAFSTKKRGGTYRPKLSIVICGKRHHSRFFPTESEHATRNGNTRPGTVVDKGVTAVFDFDFYLQAHAGLQGHVKATHYTVIYDENSFGADAIQQGTHHASYMYARATKAVSLVPPAYYADIACERGRCYLNDFLSFEDPEENKGKGKGKGKQQDKGKGKDREAEKARVYNLAKQAWGQGLDNDIKDTMFYI